MKYKLVIFDLDGTVLNTIDDLADSLNYALSCGDYPLRSTTEVKSFVGNGLLRLIELGVPQNTSKECVKKTFDCFNEHYAKHCADKTRPYDGVIQMLKKLKKMGMLTAVLSNKADYAVQNLCEKYFKGLFDAAMGMRQGTRPKPYPDAAEEILRILKADKESTLYVGDSEVDIKTAKNANLNLLCVDWGFRDRCFLLSRGAEKIISQPDEIFKILSE